MNKNLISVYKSSAPPFPTAVMAHCFISSMNDSIGVDDAYSTYYDFITDKNGHWYFWEEDIKRIAPKVVDVFMANPELADKCRSRYLHYMNYVNEILEPSSLREKLSSMSDEAISELLVDVTHNYRLAAYYIEPPNFSLEIGGQEIIRQKVQDHLQQSGYTLTKPEFENLFALLVNFTEPSFVQEAEFSLLNIALLDEADRGAAIEEHRAKYYWQVYDYHGPLLDTEMIKEELQPLSELPEEEIKRRLQEAQDRLKQNEEQLHNNLVKYNFPEDLAKLTEAVRKLAYTYSDIKKQETSKANVGLGEILKFVAKKNNIDEYLLHYATQEEILALLKTGDIDSDKLRRRTKSSILAIDSPTEYYRFLDESEETEIKSYFNDNEEQAVAQLKGTSASVGKYTGPVKVCMNVSQISKVAEGDVLVATMTSVGYVPAMKKAKAIITDIGGITSHAAIVSRELGIPCIVGLGNATSVFKDGDMVEVNANHGMVKKISD